MFGGEWGRWHAGTPAMSFAWRCSGGSGLDDGEVDVGLEHFVEIIGPGVQCDVQDDLDHLRVRVTGEFHGREIRFRDVSAAPRYLRGEADGGIGLGSFDAPLRFAVISASSRRATFLPR